MVCTRLATSARARCASFGGNSPKKEERVVPSRWSSFPPSLGVPRDREKEAGCCATRRRGSPAPLPSCARPHPPLPPLHAHRRQPRVAASSHASCVRRYPRSPSRTARPPRARPATPPAARAASFSRRARAASSATTRSTRASSSSTTSACRSSAPCSLASPSRVCTERRDATRVRRASARRDARLARRREAPARAASPREAKRRRAREVSPRSGGAVELVGPSEDRVRCAEIAVGRADERRPFAVDRDANEETSRGGRQSERGRGVGVGSFLVPSRDMAGCLRYPLKRPDSGAILMPAAPSTVRPLARDLRVLIGWPFPLGFGLDGRLLLARRGRVYV